MLEALRSEIRRAIFLYCDEPFHRDAMLRALARPGFALHPEAPCRAGALTLEAYRTIRGSLDGTAVKAAAAVELQMDAAYMFDHVADQEVDPKHGLTPAEELALAIAVQSCGAALACQAALSAGPNASALRSVVQFHANYIGACSGQFLDAHLERRDGATTDDALKMTALKSGSLGRFATAFGASMATDNREMVRLFGDFGFNLFTYTQLVDDLRDACPAQGPQRDLAQRKKTLPLVFFYSALAQGSPGGGGIILPPSGERASVDIRREFEASGAEAFGAIVAETFLNRAKSILADIKGRVGSVENLEQFIAGLEIHPQEILVAS